MFSWASGALMSRRKLTSSRWYLPILIEFRANSQTISYPATCRKSNFIPPLFSPEIKKKKINTQLFKMILQWRVPLEPQKHTVQVTAPGPTPPPRAAQLAKSGWICYSDSPAKTVPLSHYIWWMVEMPQPKWGKAPSVVINSRGSGFRRAIILWVS